MSDYLKSCLGLTVLLLGCLTLAGQDRAADPIRERDPVITAAGDVLYFTRPEYRWNQGPDDQPDIWMRCRDKQGKWNPAINPGSPINSFGPDRLLHVSVDGNRLAVLRGGAAATVDLLERSGRNWRIVDGWELPADVRDLDNLTFNANSLTLVYTAPARGGTDQDLYVRRAAIDGTWSPAEPLEKVNNESDEGSPQFASDGRTLLFRRSGKWWQQADRGEAATKTDIASRFLQVAVGPSAAMGMTDEVGRDERIAELYASEADLIAPAKLHFASLGTPPAPGDLTATVPLSSGVSLRVQPDVLGRYAIYLRDGEVDFPTSSVPKIDQRQTPGSLASVNSLPVSDRSGYLRRNLARRQRELAQLNELRQRLAFTGPQPLPASAIVDTLPPGTTEKGGNTTRSRYADDLSELERMKEKFRQQQRERMRRRDQSAVLPFTVGEVEAPPAGQVPSAVDSSVLRANVQSGLYAPQPAPLTAHRKWERNLRDDLPNTGSLSASEIARLDAEYARQMEEIEALRQQLQVEVDRRLHTVEKRSSAGDQYSRKSVATVDADPDDAAPTSTFLPNSAYLSADGYRAIDRLADEIGRSDTVLEIRVHTGNERDARAAQVLSEERATTISEALIELGVPFDHFKVIGYGNHLSPGEERIEIVR
ncbi:OmpA family protein [Lewinella sp. IMCC34191]|uniref:OmpA family protein n=1 Tax=Lewinella sp. IMCC34191 TaxID=2259172 RepID=UPI000E261DAB|nr:OmpA family protein [Lewinella sp. IMCC34191]